MLLPTPRARSKKRGRRIEVAAPGRDGDPAAASPERPGLAGLARNRISLQAGPDQRGPRGRDGHGARRRAVSTAHSTRGRGGRRTDGRPPDFPAGETARDLAEYGAEPP